MRSELRTVFIFPFAGARSGSSAHRRGLWKRLQVACSTLPPEGASERLENLSLGTLGTRGLPRGAPRDWQASALVLSLGAGLRAACSVSGGSAPLPRGFALRWPLVRTPAVGHSRSPSSSDRAQRTVMLTLCSPNSELEVHFWEGPLWLAH